MGGYEPSLESARVEQGEEMKKEYSKPGLKALGLLRVVTKLSTVQPVPPPHS
jgi:hypothetical protein